MAVSEKYILHKGHMVSPTRLIMHVEKCCVVFSLLLMAIFACGVIREYLDLPQVDCGTTRKAQEMLAKRAKTSNKVGLLESLGNILVGAKTSNYANYFSVYQPKGKLKGKI